MGCVHFLQGTWFHLSLLALPTRAKILCLEYSSLRDFEPLCNRSNFISGFLKDYTLAGVET
jgi:hypothetical protein